MIFRWVPGVSWSNTAPAKDLSGRPSGSSIAPSATIVTGLFLAPLGLIATSTASSSALAFFLTTIVAGGLAGFDSASVKVGQFIVMICVLVIHRDLLFDKLFDIHEELMFFRSAIGNGIASGSSPSGASDAVNVGLGFVGKVEINDKSDVFNVDPAGCDVCGDQDWKFA